MPRNKCCGSKRTRTANAIISGLLAFPAVARASDYYIPDGEPVCEVSPAIVVRNTTEVDAGWVAAAYGPPGVWQDPISGQLNFVYVRVRRTGSFDAEEFAQVHVAFGRGPGAFSFSSPTIHEEPPADWSSIAGDTVLRIRHLVPPPLDRACATVDPVLHPEFDPVAATPEETGWYWYRFTWEPDRIPPLDGSDCHGEPFIIAWVYSPQDPPAGDGVCANDNLAMRIFSAPAACTCGDGLVTPWQLCDDGDDAAGDGCSAVCTVEKGWDCAGEPSVCTPTCGDGLTVGGEVCDGAELQGATCATYDYADGVLACDADCLAFDFTGCLAEDDVAPRKDRGGCRALPDDGHPEALVSCLAWLAVLVFRRRRRGCCRPHGNRSTRETSGATPTAPSCCRRLVER
jgi:cysteine-rich repeat protein